MSTQPVSLDTIVALAKRRGFVYPTSSIYGGLANSYDYGTVGAELMRNIRNLWWKNFISQRDDMVGIDSQIMLHPQTWVASGHVASFTDPLVEDSVTHKRYRADHLIEQEKEKAEKEMQNLAGPVRDDTDYLNFFKTEVLKNETIQLEVLQSRIFDHINRSYLNILIDIVGKPDKYSQLSSDGKEIIDYILSESKYYYKSITGESNTRLLTPTEKIWNKVGKESASSEETKLLALSKYFYFWGTKVEDLTIELMTKVVKAFNIKSPEKNGLSDAKVFNLLFETSIGSVSGEKSVVYLRGETAQGIFTNFKNIIDSSRVQLPFGVGQIGKSFRNEVTTGQFVFRTLEFEQAEIEYFFDPEQTEWQPLFEQWKKDMWAFVTEVLGINPENLRWRQHTDTERSHYSLDTYDMEYNYPFGWKELWGVAYRTDYDLKQHILHSGVSLEYTDPFSGKKVVPHVIEPAVGVNRLFLMILMDAYYHDEEKNRVVLKLAPALAPYKVAVFPLVKNKEEIVGKAREIYSELKKQWPAVWDDRGNIGKRYLSMDEIGTPFCVTVDYQTLEDGTVTVRDRDTAEQERVKVEELQGYLGGKFK